MRQDHRHQPEHAEQHGCVDIDAEQFLLGQICKEQGPGYLVEAEAGFELEGAIESAGIMARTVWPPLLR